MEIKRIEKLDNETFQRLRTRLNRSRLTVTYSNPEGSRWVLAYIQDQIVGCQCIVVKGTNARIKSGTVMIDFRNQGIFNKIHEETMAWVKELGVQTCDAFAGRMSLNSLLRFGFQKIRQTNNQPTWYVTKQL